MDKIYKFNAVINSKENIDGAYIKFPYDTKECFGKNGIIKVFATFNGYEYRGILAKMGTECHIIGITKDIRSKINKGPGDLIEVTIKEDNESRLEKIPYILQENLDNNNEAKNFFMDLTDSQKNKFIKFIVSAKKDETKKLRLEKVIEMLNNKEDYFYNPLYYYN